MRDSQASPRKIAFSKTRLETLPIPERGRVYYTDSQTAGLTVCVTDTGAKTFYLVKKVDARTQFLRLGRFPNALTVEQARKLAASYNVAIAGGHDPQEAKRARREEATFAELWTYWETYCQGRKKPVSIAGDRQKYEAYLKDWAGHRLSGITHQDVAALHSRMGANNGPYQANRVLSLVKSMFNKAGALGWKGENPARGIERFSETARDRFLTPEELPAFFKALHEEPNPILQAFFLLALLTGARRGNLVAMRWEEISWELRQWRIPNTKAGMAVVVPLSPPAMQILQQLKGQAKTDCPWVFPARRGESGHIKDPIPAWRKLLQRAGLKDLRIHDLRRSLGSWQALCGASLPIIGKSLGHTRPETTAIYARLLLDPVRESVERAGAAMIEAGKAKDGTNAMPTRRGPDDLVGDCPAREHHENRVRRSET